MDTKLQIAFFILVGIIILIGVIWAITTEGRLKRFFLGKKAKDLEDTITLLEEDITKLKGAKEIAEKNIATINNKLKKYSRTRDHPFQSFSGPGQ